MATLVVRNFPDDLYQKLKRTAAAHHRSITRETVVLLKDVLDDPETPSRKKPITWEEFAEGMHDLWGQPVLETRTPDEIIGYDANGLPT